VKGGSPSSCGLEHQPLQDPIRRDQRPVAQGAPHELGRGPPPPSRPSRLGVAGLEVTQQLPVLPACALCIDYPAFAPVLHLLNMIYCTRSSTHGCAVQL
jgi:hypothetical protein